MIRRLNIKQFRCIKFARRNPAWLDVILVGSDGGKATALEAVARLFSPPNVAILSASDCYQRALGLGFTIQAVIPLPRFIGIGLQRILAGAQAGWRVLIGVAIVTRWEFCLL